MLRGGQRAGADRRRQPVLDGVGRRDRLVERADALERRSPDRTPPRGASVVPGLTSTSTVGGKKQPPASSPSATACTAGHDVCALAGRCGRPRRPSPRPPARRSAGPSSRRRGRPGPTTWRRGPRDRPRRAARSWIASSTSTRPAPVHAWPLSENDDRATTSAAASRSASASTTTGFLPPSSSCRRWPRRAAAWIFWPTAVEPVNVTAATSASATRWAPAAKPCTTLSTPARQAGVDERLGEPVTHQRRHRRGLEHDGVAGRQRRADLAAGQVEREVPRRDHGDDADRVEHRVHERRVVARERRAGEPVRLAGVELEVLRRAARLVAGVGERLALLGHHLGGDVAGPLGEQPAARLEQVGALRSASCAASEPARRRPRRPQRRRRRPSPPARSTRPRRGRPGCGARTSAPSDAATALAADQVEDLDVMLIVRRGGASRPTWRSRRSCRGARGRP